MHRESNLIIFQTRCDCIQFIIFLYGALHVSGVDTDSCVLHGRFRAITDESVPTQQSQQMVVDPVNQNQKL